jgi:hypothetical protein
MVWLLSPNPARMLFFRNDAGKIDYLAMRLLLHIFEKVYREMQFPETEAFIQ